MSMMNRSRLIIVGSIIVLCIVAFSITNYIADFEAVNSLKLVIKNARLSNIQLTNCQLLVTVAISNPSQRNLYVESVSLRVFLAESYIGNASLSSFSSIHNSTQEQIVSLLIYYSDVAHAVIEAIENRDFNILVSGDAYASVFFGLFHVSVPFTATFSS